MSPAISTSASFYLVARKPRKRGKIALAAKKQQDAAQTVPSRLRASGDLNISHDVLVSDILTNVPAVL